MKFRGDILYWLFKKSLMILFLSFGMFFLKKTFLRDLNIAQLFYYILGIIFYLGIDFLKNIIFRTWEVTADQLVSKEGVIYQKTNYLELYRIYDYAVNRSLLQQVFKVYDVEIHSTDKTDGILLMKNVSSKVDIVCLLRSSAEELKKGKRILEVVNE